jgi:hypothetical protein
MLFGSLFDVGNDGHIMSNDKTVSLCPELFEVLKNPRMGSNMVRWISAVYDYHSPYRNLPLEERIKTATNIYFNKDTHYLTKDPIVVAAVKEYQRLQYNPLIEQYHAIREKMRHKTEVYSKISPDEKNFSQISEMEVEMEKTATSLEKIKDKILKDMETKNKLQGGEESGLSFIEQSFNIGA